MPFRPLLLATAALLAAGTAARAQSNAYGAMSNFDVFNDDPSGRRGEGFVIELEGAQPADVLYSFSYDRYGAPSVVAYDDTARGGGRGTRVIYAATWTGSAWQTAMPSYGSGTPAIAAARITPTMGHDCVAGSATFIASACEHFGISLNYTAAVTAVKYYWLVDGGAGQLVPGATASVPQQPLPVIAPPAVPAARPVVRQVQQQVEKPEPLSPQYGDAMWVKVYSSFSAARADLKTLLTGNAAVPTSGATVKIHWALLQKPPAGVPAEKQDVENDTVPKGKVQVTKRYEFYRFTGPYDSETHEALCDITIVKSGAARDCSKPVTAPYTAPDGPTGNPLPAPRGNLGAYVGADMVGVNVQ